MQYLAVKATVTGTTDLRRVRPGAFAETIREWQSVGRLVTLHDNHDPAVIVGEVDPDSMVETRDGLKVSGKADLRHRARQRDMALTAGEQDRIQLRLPGDQGTGSETTVAARCSNSTPTRSPRPRVR